MEKVGVVTVTYNSEDVFHAFLRDVASQKHTNFILYIIDNASNDSTLEILSRFKDIRIKLIKNSNNKGVAVANNQGIREAIKDNCSQILLLNNDIEFPESLFNDLLLEQKQRQCSMVVPKIMYFDKKDVIWYAGGNFNKNRGYLPFHKGFNEVDSGQFDQPIQVDYASTCCLLLKQEVFDDIGYMDEKFFVYFDDTDFLFRVLQNGKHKLWFCPQVAIFHKVGSLSRSFVKNQKKRLFRGDFFLKQNIKNHIYFLRKVGGVYSYLFCVYLLFRNNMRFLFSPRIKKNLSTWYLINSSYFQGWRL